MFSYNDLNKIGKANKDMAIRQLREPLLKAFDIYKSNVNYGVEVETELERIEIMAWYQNLLDKQESALVYVPLKIQRYL